MERFIIDELIRWKEQDLRKPLLVRGARQVGKTYIIRSFSRKFYKSLHEINFERNPEMVRIFERDYNPVRIIAELELFVGAKIKGGEDLLFFDEIQECPKAIVALRYFYEEMPGIHIISAGSLLEFALEEISFPIGRIQMLNMYPMNFSEFLLALGKTLLVEFISKNNQDQSENIVQLINEEMHKYFIVGGMPESVDRYVKSNSFLECINLHKELISTFRQDFSKYAEFSDKGCLNSVLTSVALNTGNQIKYTRLDDNFTGPTIKKAFDMMETARLFSKVKVCSPSGIPLGSSVSEKKFKTVFLDIGLLSSMNGFYSDISVKKNRLAAAFNGKMAEQFVGQELRYLKNGDLYYWKREARGSSAEIDFLIQHNDEIIPIEVKSGKYGRLRSLHLLLDSFPNVKRSVVFTEDKFGAIENGKICFYPLYKVNSVFMKPLDC